MGSQWTKDNVYKKAMQDGYRARSAYKLIDINVRFKMIRPTDNVLESARHPVAGFRF